MFLYLAAPVQAITYIIMKDDKSNNIQNQIKTESI